MSKYRHVIGLEIHVELKTKSKMFCQCSADYFGKKPNSHTCPVCLGLPGALPVPNKKAIDWTILIGQALNCKINKVSKFDRKHYFYPDLPKGYQISQYDMPLASQGNFQFSSASRRINFQDKKNVKIRRVHLEEDTGKLIHLGDDTLVDFNRSGVPLVEIVTEPDFHNSGDVKRFLEELHAIIRYLDVSDADMEKGTMRIEPNISLIKLKVQSASLRTKCKVEGLVFPNYKVEVKNINSFRFVKQAIEYEIKRQMEVLESGETPIQETRGYNEKKGITFSQRTKEEAHDYRYFPEPDIPPMVFSNAYIDQIFKEIPELPQQKLKRYVTDFNLRYQDAVILTRNKNLCIYFEDSNEKLKMKNEKLQLKIKNFEQQISNLIINKKIPTDLPIDDFVEKAIELLKPKETDMKSLDVLINQLIDTNKKAVDDYQKGKQNALMFLVGQAMKELRGKVDANIVREELLKKLKTKK